MRRRTLLTTFALMLSLLVAGALNLAAADKKAKAGQLNGTVKMINKDKST